VFEKIKLLKPHFHSLREIDGNVSLDIKIPLNWKYEETVKLYSTVKMMVQDKNEKYSLLSLIAAGTMDGYEVAFTCAKDIVDLNRDEEEKQKLFQEKVRELQELFKKQPLEKLKDINLFDRA
jgi:hypothetical protein